MKTVTVNSPGKINLALDITGRSPDGYHTLDSVMQSISLCDTVTVSCIKGSGIYSSCDSPRIPCDENNLVYKAARAFLTYFSITPPFAISIDLQKRIPIEAGLGGGSADAAAVIVALNALLEVYADFDTLCDLGISVGSDVPFCIKGGTRRVVGEGGRMLLLPQLPYCYIVIAKPAAGISTSGAYALYDALPEPVRADTSSLLHGIYNADLRAACTGMNNVLESVANLHEVVLLKEMLINGGALGAAMSGSGSAVVGIFEDKGLAKRCMRRLYSQAKSVFLCAPVYHGPQFESCVHEKKTI